MADATTALGVDLYRSLATRDGNLFLSPASLESALSMLAAGSRCSTAVEMHRVLHLQMPENRLQKAFGRLTADWNRLPQPAAPNQQPAAAQPPTAPQLELLVANALWSQRQFPLAPAYVELCRRVYGAQLANLDFAAGDAARTAINDWARHETRGHIGEILPAGSISPATRLVVTNAVYFRGVWQQPFAAKESAPAPFRLAGGKTTPAVLMHNRGTFRYREADGLQMLELPYVGDASLVVLLPKTVDGLSALEQRLSAVDLSRWIGELSPTTVNVELPRFKFDAQFELSGVLTSLGMHEAFSPQANFCGISGQRGLQLSGVVHRAMVDVNEEGTVASAATAAGAAEQGMHSLPKVFRADHPFIFLIRDTNTGATLFVGRCANPQL